MLPGKDESANRGGLRVTYPESPIIKTYSGGKLFRLQIPANVDRKPLSTCTEFIDAGRPLVNMLITVRMGLDPIVETARGPGNLRIRHFALQEFNS